jgi:hypothetical protein
VYFYYKLSAVRDLEASIPSRNCMTIYLYKARFESTRKAHIMLPRDSSKAFVDPLFLRSVDEADATGVLVVAFLTLVGDADVAEVFVVALSLAFRFDGGGGLVNDAGYGAVSVRIGDWSAL